MSWNKYLALTHGIFGIWAVSFYFNATFGVEIGSSSIVKIIIMILGLSFILLTYGFYRIKNWARVTSLILLWLSMFAITIIVAMLIYHWGFYKELFLEVIFIYGFLVMGILLLNQPTIVNLYKHKTTHNKSLQPTAESGG